MDIIKIQGELGWLEAIVETPGEVTYPEITAVLCHPHPLFQGTMHNKVVTTMARVFRDLGIQSIRFNYRGVGGSEGEYGEGVGELDDTLKVIEYIKQQKPGQKLILAGFSFGGSVAYKAAAISSDVMALLTIAPAVINFPVDGFNEPQMPWCVVQGIDDEVVDADAVFDVVLKKTKSDATIIKMNEVGHFFHGKLTDLKQELTDYFQPRLSRLNHGIKKEI
ncbi:MAG: alpha/beta hydrolase [Francisellaceae bacterium]